MAKKGNCILLNSAGWWTEGHTLHFEGNGEVDYCVFLDIDQTNIESIIIASEYISIEPDAFAALRNLKNVIIHSDNIKISQYAFRNCYALASVVIQGNVEEIGKGTFLWCGNLKSVTIPNSVRKIGENAFLGCKSLTSVIIPGSVQEIGPSAFSRCTELTNIRIPDGIKYIHEDTFYECEKLTSIMLPDSVKAIMRFAFARSGLTSIAIPNSVEIIEDFAFEACTDLTSITLPHNMIKRGDILYYSDPTDPSCSWDITAHSGSCGYNLTWKQEGDGIYFEGEGARKHDLPGYPLSHFIDYLERDFANNMEEIEDRAFNQFKDTVSLRLSKNVIEIGDAFCLTGLSEKNYPWLIVPPCGWMEKS